jgi:hypothetical protein
VLLLQILVGNKSDMADEKRAVPYAKGQALAEEYGMRFFETSAKDNINVEEVGAVECAPYVSCHCHASAMHVMQFERCYDSVALHMLAFETSAKDNVNVEEVGAVQCV